MSLPFGFGQPDDADRPSDPQDPLGLAAMGQMLSQLGAMLANAGRGGAPSEVDWEQVRTQANHVVAAAGNPAPSPRESEAIDAATRLATLWLDDACQMPALTTPAQVWRRTDWVDATIAAWARLISPVVASMVRTVGAMGPGVPGQPGTQISIEIPGMDALPPEAAAQIQAMLGPLQAMARGMAVSMMTQQVGRALASLAGDVLGSSDIGVPLQSAARSALIPANIAAFGEGLELPATDVLLYVALREEAHQRLFAAVPWLGPRMESAIADFAAGVTIDTSRIEEAMRDIDPTNPQALHEAMASGVFEPVRSPQQEASLARLETLLALVEGWVDDVVSLATTERMPTAPALRETMRRRRAAAGPAERTFAQLVGLELRPRRAREAATLWARLREAGHADYIWAHPDLVPDAAELDDPDGVVARINDTQFPPA